jgi:hypothetical protein
MAKQTSDLRRWALLGAEQRLKQIAEEAAVIHREFPQLRRGPSATTAQVPVPRGVDESLARPVGRRRRRKLSEAQRKAISKRMKAYWKGRRAGKAKK